MKYIIANWKSHKTLEEAQSWLTAFAGLIQSDSSVSHKISTGEAIVVLAVPAPFIVALTELAKEAGLHMAAQNISHFDAGSYTGEVSGRNLQNIVEYVIVGHSERRIHLHETNAQVETKIMLAKESAIVPILCVRSASEYQGAQGADVPFVAFEAFEAIGTGNNVPLEDVLKVRESLQLTSTTKFIYGASVDEENAHVYLQHEHIDGVLVGTASLDPKRFFTIVSKA
jgi:triosephosphate isomerase (TIM)